MVSEDFAIRNHWSFGVNVRGLRLIRIWGIFLELNRWIVLSSKHLAKHYHFFFHCLSSHFSNSYLLLKFQKFFLSFFGYFISFNFLLLCSKFLFFSFNFLFFSSDILLLSFFGSFFSTTKPLNINSGLSTLRKIMIKNV